jgi:hypothetical protein
MEVPEVSRNLADYMAQQLRVRGGRLADVAGRAGRRLPHKLHEDVADLIEAEAMSRHPKMARMVDRKRVQRAEKRIRHFLDQQSPGAERRGAILDRIAAVAFILFSITLATFFWLLWRGHFG